jgi:DNA-binding NarL/FixJ family response regulator
MDIVFVGSGSLVSHFVAISLGLKRESTVISVSNFEEMCLASSIPDVVIINTRDPRMDALDCTLAIAREYGGKSKLIWVGNGQESHYAYIAHGVGVRGMISDVEDVEDFLDGIRLVGEGEIYISPKLAELWSNTLCGSIQ